MGQLDRTQRGGGRKEGSGNDFLPHEAPVGSPGVGSFTGGL